MRRTVPFETAELDDSRRRHRELLLSIDDAHLATTLDKHRVRRLQLPDDVTAERWAGAELEARKAVDRLLAQEETAAYASASRARRSAALFYRAVQLIEPFEFAAYWTAGAAEERQSTDRAFDDVCDQLRGGRRVVGQLIEALLLAEIVSTDDWEFPPLVDALAASG